MPVHPLLRRALFASTLASLAACGGKPPAEASGDVPSAVALPAPPAGVDKLDIVDLRPGSGPAVTAGQKVVVQYTGWLYETAASDHKGKEFDSSRNSGQPFRFVVGAGQVIKGWDQGILGMSPGASRRLTIPPDLGYGDVGAGGVIPPGATLIFDVELVGIE